MRRATPPSWFSEMVHHNIARICVYLALLHNPVSRPTAQRPKSRTIRLTERTKRSRVSCYFSDILTNRSERATTHELRRSLKLESCRAIVIGRTADSHDECVLEDPLVVRRFRQ